MLFQLLTLPLCSLLQLVTGCIVAGQDIAGDIKQLNGCIPSSHVAELRLLYGNQPRKLIHLAEAVLPGLAASQGYANGANCAVLDSLLSLLVFLSALMCDRVLNRLRLMLQQLEQPPGRRAP